MAGLSEIERDATGVVAVAHQSEPVADGGRDRTGRRAARPIQTAQGQVAAMSEIRKIGNESRVAPVTELPPQPQASAAPPPGTAMKKHRGRFTRPLLLFGVPLLVVLFSCYAYLHAGRFVDTNNAYVKADKAIIAAEVNGKIVEVAVRENDHVEAGQLLFRLDDTPYRFALDRAEAALAQTAQDIAATKLQYKQALAEIELAQNNVAYARVTYDRQVGLVDRKIGSISDLDDAKHALDTALKQQELASQRAAKILVDLNGNADVAVEAHPRYQQARSDRDQGRARSAAHERGRAVLRYSQQEA